MEIKYNLRNQQKLGFSLILGMMAFIIIFILSMVLLFPSSTDESTDFFLYAMVLAGLLVLMTAGVAYYFLKDTQLVIDKTGMRSTSKLLNLHPQFKPITFDSNTALYKVEDIGKAMFGSMAKLDANLEKHDTLFAFVDRHQTPQKVFMMSNNVWEIDDIDLLENQLTQLGLTIESVQVKDFIEEFIPQMADLGKKAGYLAYGCLIPIAIAFIIFSFFDKWSTIYYGAFTNVLWLVFFITLFVAIWYIKTNAKQFISHVMVAGLFALSIVFFTVISVTAIVPVVGNSLPLTFEFKETNEFKEETWVAKENSKLLIYCISKNNKENTADKKPVSRPLLQKTIAKKWFSIIRVDGKKTLCPHGRYLSDAMLPHE